MLDLCFQAKDAARRAQAKMPMIEQEERSNNEYKRGVSGWNFDLEDLKAQASLVSDRHANSIKIKPPDGSG